MAQRPTRYDSSQERPYPQSRYPQERYPRQFSNADIDEDDFDEDDASRREWRAQDYDRPEGAYPQRGGRNNPRGYQPRSREFEREQYWNRPERAGPGYASDLRGRDDYRARDEYRSGDQRSYQAGRFGYYDPARAREQERWSSGQAQQRYRGVGPKDYQRSDDRLREQVCERLADDGELDASGINVKVESGEITLNGTVDSRWAKRRAEDCAESVFGVDNCQNNLRISADAQKPDGHRSDAFDMNAQMPKSKQAK